MNRYRVIMAHLDSIESLLVDPDTKLTEDEKESIKNQIEWMSDLMIMEELKIE